MYLDLLEVFRPPHGECEPSLVIVVAIFGQLRKVTQADTAHGVRDAGSTYLGVVTQRGID